ncbi:MAG TPA: hypothetical protein VJ654_18675 [Noviherbaspirillum sp.]|nr:hypothetical protein [Noviherbaspirillum sp.]
MHQTSNLHPVIFPDQHYLFFSNKASAMPFSELLPIIIKSLAVALILGGVAYRWKQRSFLGWAAIGAAAAVIFPGLSLIALIVLAWLPKGKN